MTCSACQAENDAEAEVCFTCGKALHALTQGTVLAERYEIVSQLGTGGMGRVYRAYDRVLEEPVAVKVLRAEFAREPEMARRFLSEIKLARKVSHPNVCRIHEYGEDAGVRYISMELIEGVSLKEYLRQRPITMAEAFELALGAARGLQAVHERGIIHRDFKTSNITVDRRGHVRLLDFGIARVAGARTGTFTAAGQVIGTPESMSPEQALGARLDFRSDIYALGCVVFEIFSGQAVFQGETPLVTLFKHLHEAPPLEAPWALIPAPLVSPLRIALAKDPADRFETVAQFVAALEAARAHIEGADPAALQSPRLEGGTPASAPETATIERPSPARADTAPYAGPAGGVAPPAVWRGPRAWVAAATVVAAAAALGAALLWPRARPEPEPPATGTQILAPPPAAEPPARREVPASDRTESAPSPAASMEAGPRRERRSAVSPPPGASPAAAPGVSAAAPRLSSGSATGTLSLLIVPEAEVTLDGAMLGTISARRLSLPPGQYVVRILHPDYMPLQRKVTVKPGVTVELVMDLAEKAIRKPR